MDTPYWPFLLAANKRMDYRVVLCPDFLQEAGCSQLLRKTLAQMESDPAEGKLQFIELNDQATGPLAIFFKRTVASVAGTEATDYSSRPIMQTAGFVLRGVVDRKDFRSRDADDLLGKLKDDLQECFQRFWDAGSNPKLELSAQRQFNAPVAPVPPQEVIRTDPPRPPALQPSDQDPPLAPGSISHGSRPALKTVYVVLALTFALSAACAYRLVDQEQQLSAKYAVLERQLATKYSSIEQQLTVKYTGLEQQFIAQHAEQERQLVMLRSGARDTAKAEVSDIRSKMEEMEIRLQEHDNRLRSSEQRQ